ncbi:hypothetical protein CR970_04155 [Candidatus Saccharibacteria bacterium]|nr:MAG: hypothetical protein CR970_04155 [Candidatus Saccharibacteria bacterium]
MPFLVDVALIWVGAIAMFRYRARFGRIAKSPIARLLLFFVTLILLIYVEESINCIDYGDGLGCRVTPWINAVLCVYVCGAALLVRKTNAYGRVLLGAASIGVLWEVCCSGLRTLPFSAFYVFMTAHVFLSYVFILAWPLFLAAQSRPPRQRVNTPPR